MRCASNFRLRLHSVATDSSPFLGTQDDDDEVSDRQKRARRSKGEDDDEDEDDEEVAEDDLEEIDPTAIRGRRTRGVKVDYTSAEALAKAGLKADDADDDE